LKNNYNKTVILFLNQLLVTFSSVSITFGYSASLKYEITKNRLGLKRSVIAIKQDLKSISIRKKIDYFDDGLKHSYYSFENNLKHGKYANWSKKNYEMQNGALKQIHFLSETGYYKMGKLHGLSKSYYPDGTVFWKGKYKNGKVEGIVLEYHSNGEVYRKINYLNGNKHGKYYSYLFSGDKEIEGEYYHGMRIGEWQFSNPEKGVIEKINYNDGKAWQGTYTIWNGTKIKIDCSDELVIPVLFYDEGILSDAYRDENLNLKSCE